jgi:hypothetical protein
MNSRRHLMIGIPALMIVCALTACSRDSRAKVDAPAPVDPRFAGLGTPDHPVIVRLVGRNQVLTVSGGPKGPVYSVADAQGRTMLSNATLGELRAKHPELYQQIRGTVASDASPAVEGRGGPASDGIAHIGRVVPPPILIMSRHD